MGFFKHLERNLTYRSLEQCIEIEKERSVVSVPKMTTNIVYDKKTAKYEGVSRQVCS